MVTVREILDLSEMSEANIRAGREGLDRQVRWSHVIEHEDMGAYLEGGELLLTSGQIWSTDEEKINHILKTFLEKQIAGIVFATGRYLKKSPEKALEFGEKHSIPIVEVPFQVPFVKVIRSIHEIILADKKSLLQSRDHVSSNLIEQFKLADSITDICRVVSENLESYVLLTDYNNRVLTKISPAGIQHINELTIFDKVRETTEMRLDQEAQFFFQPNQVTFIPSKTPPYGLFVPIHTNENSDFILWVFDPYYPLEQKDEKVAEYTSFMLKDMISNEKEVMAEISKRRLELLETLMNETRYDQKAVETKAREHGLDNIAYWKVGLIHSFSDDTSVDNMLTWRNECEQWLSNVEGISGFAEKFGDQVLVLIGLHETQDEIAVLHGLKDSIARLTKEHHIVCVFSSLKDSLHLFQTGYQEVKTLLPIVQSKKPNDILYFARDLQREFMLYGHLNREEAQDLRGSILPEELFSHKNTFLYETLKHLATYGYNQEQVANIMRIHRNTLRYRIKRLEELLNESLASPRGRFWIQVALDLEPIITKNE